MDYRPIIKESMDNPKEKDPLDLLYAIEYDEKTNTKIINDNTDLNNLIEIALDYNISAYDVISGKIPRYILEFLYLKSELDDMMISGDIPTYNSNYKPEKKYKNDNVVVPFKRNEDDV